MKKITTAVALAACMSAGSASADTILGVYAGVQSWNMDSVGSFGYVNDGSDSTAAFTFDTDNQNSFYIALEHPIPLVPNVKIKRNNMETTGTTNLLTTFEFADTVFDVSSDLSTNVDLSNTDYILYYEILDNDLVTVDLGINAKNINGVINVVSLQDPSVNANESFDGFVPMAYGNVEIGLPFTGLTVYAEGSLLSIDGHSLHDYEMGIAYTFVDNLAVDLTVQLGYRSFLLELDDLEKVNTNLEFDGVFVGLEVHF